MYNKTISLLMSIVLVMTLSPILSGCSDKVGVSGGALAGVVHQGVYDPCKEDNSSASSKGKVTEIDGVEIKLPVDWTYAKQTQSSYKGNNWEGGDEYRGIGMMGLEDGDKSSEYDNSFSINARWEYCAFEVNDPGQWDRTGYIAKVENPEMKLGDTTASIGRHGHECDSSYVSAMSKAKIIVYCPQTNKACVCAVGFNYKGSDGGENCNYGPGVMALYGGLSTAAMESLGGAGVLQPHQGSDNAYCEMFFTDQDAELGPLEGFNPGTGSGISNSSGNSSRGQNSSSGESYAMNAWSIGIEIVHEHNDPRGYPEAQLKAVDKLVSYIDKSVGSKPKIIDHKEWSNGPNSTNIKQDCSDDFPLQNYKSNRSHDNNNSGTFSKSDFIDRTGNTKAYHGDLPKDKVKYIVMHDTESGTDNHTDIANAFDGRSDGVAAHFIVGRNGEVIQYIPIDKITHHAGKGGYGRNEEFGITQERDKDLPDGVSGGVQSSTNSGSSNSKKSPKCMAKSTGGNSSIAEAAATLCYDEKDLSAVPMNTSNGCTCSGKNSCDKKEHKGYKELYAQLDLSSPFSCECSTLTPTAVKWAGADDGMNNTYTGDIIDHCTSSDKWEEVHVSSKEDLQPGDIFVQHNDQHAHTFVYCGEEAMEKVFPGKGYNVAEASWGDHAPRARNLGNNEINEYRIFRNVKPEENSKYKDISLS